MAFKNESRDQRRKRKLGKRAKVEQKRAQSVYSRALQVDDMEGPVLVTRLLMGDQTGDVDGEARSKFVAWRGWCMQYTYGPKLESGSALHQLSAEWRGEGSVNDRLVDLQQVRDELKVPAKGSSDLLESGQPASGQRTTWRWFTTGPEA